eukprot:Clim_evm79s150 gene=Clim_evmTU79s150
MIEVEIVDPHRSLNQVETTMSESEENRTETLSPKRSDSWVDVADETNKGYEDLLGSGDLLYKVIEPSQRHSQDLSPGQHVTVRYVLLPMEFSKDLSVETFAQETPKDIDTVLGDDDVCSAFDLVVRMLHKGDSCIIKSRARFAFAEFGNGSNIGPNQDIAIYVTVKEVGDMRPPPEVMTAEQRVNSAEGRKERGNEVLHTGDIQGAFNIYNKAVSFLVEDGVKDAVQLQQIRATRAVCLNNRAFAEIKLKEPKKARTTLKEVLELDEKNVKALYRMALSHESTKEYEEAVWYYTSCLGEDPNNGSAKVGLARCKEARKAEVQKQRDAYSKMIDGYSGGRAESESSSGGDKTVDPRKPMVTKLEIAMAIALAIISALLYIYIFP